MKIHINTDKELVAEIDKKLEENFEKYGFEYCPCTLVYDSDHICMCKEFKEQESGTCHCGKYIKE